MQESVRQDREKYIGGSDMPAVMGISPFTKRFDLLLQKAGIAENTFEGNEYTRYGEEMEPKIRDYLNDERGWDFKEDKRTADDIPIGRRYHADGYSEFMECVLEIKTTSQMHEDVNDYGVYLVQLLFGMEMFDCQDGLLAVYERPDDFNTDFDAKRLHLYPIRLSDFKGVQEEIEARISAFTEDLKALRENPFLSESELPSMQGVVPAAREVEMLETQLVAYKDLEAKYKDAKQRLCDAMEKNGIKSWTTDNGFRFTYVPKGDDKEVEKFDDKRFAEEHPRLWKQYRVMTKKKGAKSYVRVTMPKKVSGD